MPIYTPPTLATVMFIPEDSDADMDAAGSDASDEEFDGSDSDSGEGDTDSGRTQERCRF